ncbi:MAG TPA: hypothetical protein VK174_04300 [Chitinophagales bacterium]|nr:hypothetical protein [Chitinophagales bacterium]
MKTKYAIVIFVAGFCIDFIGALLKIMHWPGANALLIIGMILKVAGGILFLYKLLRYKELKNFLDS